MNIKRNRRVNETMFVMAWCLKMYSSMRIVVIFSIYIFIQSITDNTHYIIYSTRFSRVDEIRISESDKIANSILRPRFQMEDLRFQI